MQWIPSVEDVTKIHNNLVTLFECQEDPISPSGIKSLSMLESACTRPLTSLGKTEKYPSLNLKAAALFHSLTKNHAFHNGNKRTAVVTLLTLLHRNDKLLSMDVNDDILYDFVLKVTSDEFPEPNHGQSVDLTVERIANWIKNHTKNSKFAIGAMKTSDFKQKCSMAGAQVKDSGSSFVVSFGNRSIRINQNTKALDGPIVQKYLKRLRMTEASSGVAIGEFQFGASGEREEIHRFMTALKRLAKT
ncbi:MAG: type II toxin-antitoxin system death-on-curing family toxin [Sulfuricella sp.]|nr:type II toxin-antitoxin system death-on-curing family toxin [Gammaproteobacteria bacterium]